MTAHDSIGARSAMTMPMTINRAVIKKIYEDGLKKKP